MLKKNKQQFFGCIVKKNFYVKHPFDRSKSLNKLCKLKVVFRKSLMTYLKNCLENIAKSVLTFNFFKRKQVISLFLSKVQSTLEKNRFS